MLIAKLRDLKVAKSEEDIGFYAGFVDFEELAYYKGIETSDLEALAYYKGIEKSDLSSKIIEEALKQQTDILQEENRSLPDRRLKASFSAVSASPSGQEENDEEEGIDAFDVFSDILSQYDGGELEIDEEDEKVLSTFMPKETGPQLILSDIIIQRTNEKAA